MDIGQPVGLRLSVRNNSNVDIDTIPVQLQVWDLSYGTGYTGSDFLLEGASDQISPPIPAYQTSPRPQTDIFFPSSLPEGRYYARVRTENQDGPDHDSVMYLEVKDCPPCILLDHTTGSCGGTANLIQPDGTLCDDGDKCTVADTCAGGVCMGGTPNPCPAPDLCRLDGTCDQAYGECVYPPAPAGTPCDDGNACTVTDACESGACVGADPVVCAASDACHEVGTCDPVSGVCSDPMVPDGTVCPTGTCQDGVCEPGAAGAAGSAGSAGSAPEAGSAGSAGGAPEAGAGATTGSEDAGGSAGGMTDAGMPDGASEAPDAPDLDAGAQSGDSLGLSPTGSRRDEEGCACRTGRGRNHLGWIVALAGVALLVRRRVRN